MSLKLAFGCQARVGKSTAVEYLRFRHGGLELSFAQPLYDILYFAQETCGFEKKKDRKFLQWVGTEWGREQDPNLWVNLLLRKVEENPDTNIFISDLRFPNELKALKKAGFTCIKIKREEAQEGLSSAAKVHSSETALLDMEDSEWDIVINNNSLLEDFYETLDSVCENL